MPDATQFLVIVGVILLALSLHEFAHAKMADLAGDPTPRMYGRVTLNPINHLDPIGTVMIILTAFSGFGIGWGRPVPMDSRRMRDPRWDFFAAVAAGPGSNLLQATIDAMVLRLAVLPPGSTEHQVAEIYTGAQGSLPQLLILGVYINVALCLFNLIPLGPLDGHWLLGTFLGESARLKWYLWNRQFGGFLLLLLVFSGQLIPQMGIIFRVLYPMTDMIARFLVGI